MICLKQLSKMSFIQCIFWDLVKKQMADTGGILGLSVLFCWSIGFIWCQFQAIFIGIGLQYKLKLTSLVPLVLLFVLKVALGIEKLMFIIWNLDSIFTWTKMSKNSSGYCMEFCRTLLIVWSFWQYGNAWN